MVFSTTASKLSATHNVIVRACNVATIILKSLKGFAATEAEERLLAYFLYKHIWTVDPAFVISISAINERLSGWYDEWGDKIIKVRRVLRSARFLRAVIAKEGCCITFEPFDTASTLAFAKVVNPFFRVTKVIVAKGIFHLQPWLFANMAYLEEVVLTDALHVPAGLCYGCALKELPDLANATRIGSYAFASTKIEGVLHIPDTVFSVGASAFKDCKKVTGVVFGERSRCYWLQRECFRGTSTQFVRFPKPLYRDCVRLGASAFANTPLKLIDGFGGVKVVGECAFENCGIERVEIPSSVKHLRMGAFRACPLLTDVQILARKEPLLVGGHVFARSGLRGIDLSNAKLVEFESGRGGGRQLEGCYNLKLALMKRNHIERGTAFRSKRKRSLEGTEENRAKVRRVVNEGRMPYIGVVYDREAQEAHFRALWGAVVGHFLPDELWIHVFSFIGARYGLEYSQ